MKLSQFKFKLPEERIALHPTKYRDESRLMVLHRKTGEIEHRVFKEILDYFDDKDVFVFNDTKVFPARLYGNKEKTGARIEVFLLRELNEELRLWDVLVDPARKIRIGNKLYFGDDDSMVAEVIDNTTSRGRTLRFLYDGPHDEFKKALYALGETPLPHSIINRPVEPEDAERFQSIFARHEGAVTAPTANLHFSRELMKRMEIKGIDFAFITLHAGLGNFREIDVEDRYDGDACHREHRQHRRPSEDLRRLDEQVHLPALRLHRGQCDGVQLPHAALHAADDCGRFRRIRAGDERLRRGSEGRLPLRYLWRCHADYGQVN